MKTPLAGLLLAACVAGCGVGGMTSSTPANPGLPAGVEPFEGPVPKASCAEDDPVETGIQGQVPQADRASGRALDGYRCNLELVGQHDNYGEGAGWQHAWYEDCSYMGTATQSNQDGVATPRGGQLHPGVAVIDASDSTAPIDTAHLTSIAMYDPWESLKVNEKRELLADVNAALGGSSTGNVNGGPEIDIYSIADDCKQPVLVSSTALGTSKGHAGHFAADGMTYYGSPITAGIIKSIDISDPASPKLLKEDAPVGTHDLSTSADGLRAYLANNDGNGLAILDVSDIQNRRPNPQMPLIGEVYWPDGSTAQMTQPMTIGGKPYILFVDELGAGAARIIDISNEAEPFIASKLKLEVHMPENADVIQNDVGSVIFGYQGHYCTASDGVTDNTTYEVKNAAIAVCGYFESGLRVFDIRDVYHPREIAYYIPPAKPTYHAGSYYNLNGNCAMVDWASSHPRYRPDRNEVWFTSQCNGFQIVKFSKPLAELLGPAP